jgi:hypothetical protein
MLSGCFSIYYYCKLRESAAKEFVSETEAKNEWMNPSARNKHEFLSLHFWDRK